MNSKIDSSEQIKRIEFLTDKFSISKYNLLKISYLVRLIQDSEKYAVECNECKENGKILNSLIDEIPFLDDIVHREPYEKKFNSIRKHFHRSHGYIPLYYFISRWSLFGLAFGVVISLSISFFTNIVFLFDSFYIGLSVGLVAGYFWGSVKELRYRKAKKII